MNDCILGTISEIIFYLSDFTLLFCIVNIIIRDLNYKKFKFFKYIIMFIIWLILQIPITAMFMFEKNITCSLSTFKKQLFEFISISGLWVFRVYLIIIILALIPSIPDILDSIIEFFLYIRNILKKHKNKS